MPITPEQNREAIAHSNDIQRWRSRMVADLTIEQLSRYTDASSRPLEAGAHEPDDGRCVMEAVAYIAGLDHTDAPACVDDDLAELLRGWNDALDDNDRQRLWSLVPALITHGQNIHRPTFRAAITGWWWNTWVRTIAAHLTPPVTSLPAAEPTPEAISELGELIGSADLAGGAPTWEANRLYTQSGCAAALTSVSDSTFAGMYARRDGLSYGMCKHIVEDTAVDLDQLIGELGDSLHVVIRQLLGGPA